MIRLTTLFLALTLCQSVFAENVLKSIHENNKGVASLELEDAAAAEQHFIQALAENPFNVLVHLNLGRTFEIQKMFDKAIKENESVLRYNGLPKELQYVAHFNAGNAAAQGEKVDLAVQHYQAALEVTPDSLETKTNIELLFKSGAGKGKGKEGKGKDKGEGEGEGGQGEQPQEPQSNQDQKEKKKEKPKFDSQNLTKEDVRKILEELKSQEQKIRAKEYGTKGKESSSDKDW